MSSKKNSPNNESSATPKNCHQDCTQPMNVENDASQLTKSQKKRLKKKRSKTGKPENITNNNTVTTDWPSPPPIPVPVPNLDNDYEEPMCKQINDILVSKIKRLTDLYNQQHANPKPPVAPTVKKVEDFYEIEFPNMKYHFKPKIVHSNMPQPSNSDTGTTNASSSSKSDPKANPKQTEQCKHNKNIPTVFSARLCTHFSNTRPIYEKPTFYEEQWIDAVPETQETLLNAVHKAAKNIDNNLSKCNDILNQAINKEKESVENGAENKYCRCKHKSPEKMDSNAKRATAADRLLKAINEVLKKTEEQKDKELGEQNKVVDKPPLDGLREILYNLRMCQEEQEKIEEAISGQDLIEDMVEGYRRYIYYNQFCDDIKLFECSRQTKIENNDFYFITEGDFEIVLWFYSQYLKKDLLIIECIKNNIYLPNLNEINLDVSIFCATLMIRLFLEKVKELFNLFLIDNILREKFVKKCVTILECQSPCFTFKEEKSLPDLFIDQFLNSITALKYKFFIQRIETESKQSKFQLQNQDMVRLINYLDDYVVIKIRNAIFLVESNRNNFLCFNPHQTICDKVHQMMMSLELIRISMYFNNNKVFKKKSFLNFGTNDLFNNKITDKNKPNLEIETKKDFINQIELCAKNLPPKKRIIYNNLENAISNTMTEIENLSLEEENYNDNELKLLPTRALDGICDDLSKIPMIKNENVGLQEEIEIDFEVQHNLLSEESNQKNFINFEMIEDNFNIKKVKNDILNQKEFVSTRKRKIDDNQVKILHNPIIEEQNPNPGEKIDNSVVNQAKVDLDSAAIIENEGTDLEIEKWNFKQYFNSIIKNRMIQMCFLLLIAKLFLPSTLDIFTFTLTIFFGHLDVIFFLLIFIYLCIILVTKC